MGLPVALITSFLFFHYGTVAEESKICDERGNSRPINVSAAEYATYCCTAEKYSWGSTRNRFSCAEQGGCCGDTDSQYCCEKSKLALKLGVGIPVGLLLIITVVIIIICCCVKKKCICSKHSDSNRSCNPVSDWSSRSRDVLDVLRTRENAPSSTPYYHAQNSGRSLEIISQEAVRSRDYNVPTAPSIPEPEQELDLFPPSYDEVVQNPHVYPETKTVSEV